MAIIICAIRCVKFDISCADDCADDSRDIHSPTVMLNVGTSSLKCSTSSDKKLLVVGLPLFALLLRNFFHSYFDLMVYQVTSMSGGG